MKYVIVFLSLFILASCRTICPEPERCKGEVDNVLIGSGNKIHISLLKEEFTKGVKVQKFWQEPNEKNKKLYLYRKGFDNKKNCYLSRTEIEPKNVEGTQVIMMRMNGATETCTGNGCSHCAFKDTGGCVCKKFSGTCNHTIVRNMDILKLF